MADSPPRSTIDAHRIDAEKLRLVYAGSLQGIAFLPIAAALVWVVLAGQPGAVWLPLWFALHLMISGFRWVLRWQFLQLPTHRVALRFWSRGYVGTMFALGLIWAWLGGHFSPDWTVAQQVAVIAVIFGICSAAALSHGLYLPANVAFFAPICAALGLRLLQSADPVYGMLGVGTLVWMLFLWTAGRRFNTTAGELIRLRIENADLADDLARVNLDLNQEVRQHAQAENLLKERSRILEMLTTGRGLDEILSALVTAAQAMFGEARCSLLVYDREAGVLRHGASLGLPAVYVRAVEGMAIGARAGSCGAAAHHKQRVVVEDVKSHPYWHGYREMAAAAGIGACWSEPVLSPAGNLLGTFAMYAESPRGPTAEELEFVQTTAQLAGIAIESRRVAEELELHRQNLESRVQQRTEELQNALREIQSFNYSASHDLRGPLRAIDGYSQILLEDYAAGLPPQAREYLQRSRAASQQMGLLIDGLLKLSRLSQRTLEPEWVNVSDICRATAQRMAADLGSRRVEWAIQDNVWAWGDRALIEVAIENLLSNAWKFTADQRLARIEFYGRDRPEGCEIVVKDNGAGFDMSFSAKLFKPFHRLHDAREFAGTGIGLATVARIVERHGGTVSAQATPGKGAEFRVLLPAEGAPAQRPLLPAARGGT